MFNRGEALGSSPSLTTCSCFAHSRNPPLPLFAKDITLLAVLIAFQWNEIWGSDLRKIKMGPYVLNNVHFSFVKDETPFHQSPVFWESSINRFLIPVIPLHNCKACVVITEILRWGWGWGEGIQSEEEEKCDLGGHPKAVNTAQEGGILSC